MEALATSMNVRTTVLRPGTRTGSKDSVKPEPERLISDLRRSLDLAAAGLGLAKAKCDRLLDLHITRAELDEQRSLLHLRARLSGLVQQIDDVMRAVERASGPANP